MRYYIIAGERSGDLHGSNLMKSLRKLDSDGSFRGFGGDLMHAEGLDLAVHYEEMAFMGFKALVTNAWTIYQKIKFCKSDINTFKPDVIILIDYGGFNRRIAKFGRSRGIKVFYYILPKVWAWYTSRAWELKRNVDRMFVILPFEKDFFKKFGVAADYVGNPVVDAVKAFRADPEFAVKNGLDPTKKIVALLPGSRKMELKKIVPLMAAIAQANPKYQFVVAVVPSLSSELYEPLTHVPGLRLIPDAAYQILSVSSAAIVTSGTATLETALFRVPQVVVYKAAPAEMLIARLVVKVPYISLVNLIGGKLVVKELIQEDANLPDVISELTRLLENEAYRGAMLSEYNRVYSILDTGSASENTAGLMIKYLLEGKR